jgi:carboxyl-terminal processing protease
MLFGNGVQMRKLICLITFAGLTACSGGSGPAGPQPGTAACSNDGQKQFVLDNLYDWYLWNDLLPADINIANYASPEELVFEVTTTYGPQNANNQPIDLFSSVGSLQADTQFFGEGKFEGFGFSWRFVDQAQTDFRLSRTFAGSPADLGGLARGQQVLSLNGRSVGEIAANEGIGAFFDANDTVVFEVQPLTGGVFTSSITKDIVTIDPIPQYRVIDAGNGRNVGYMELATFISTADAEFNTVFQAFRDANVSEVIIDLRYNGGGLVSTAELLGDYLGGFVAQNLVFSSTEFNADRAAQYNSTDFFSLLGNSLNLSQLVVIASRGTASASELVTNGMIPHVDVAIVGDRTFGKPVGQIGLEFCDKILRPTAFKLANADGNGDYFDGLPVDCPASDDLSVAVGDDLDPNMIAAMSYLNSGACPVVSVPGVDFKAAQDMREPERRRVRPAYRELIDAY